MPTESPIGRRSAADYHSTDSVLRLRLVSRLYEMVDTLAVAPEPDLSAVRDGVYELRALHQSSKIENGLLSLVLRNMIRDLAAPSTDFDALYYARQLTSAADLLAAP